MQNSFSFIVVLSIAFHCTGSLLRADHNADRSRPIARPIVSYTCRGTCTYGDSRPLQHTLVMSPEGANTDAGGKTILETKCRRFTSHVKYSEMVDVKCDSNYGPSPVEPIISGRPIGSGGSCNGIDAAVVSKFKLLTKNLEVKLQNIARFYGNKDVMPRENDRQRFQQDLGDITAALNGVDGLGAWLEELGKKQRPEPHHFPRPPVTTMPPVSPTITVIKNSCGACRKVSTPVPSTIPGRNTIFVTKGCYDMFDHYSNGNIVQAPAPYCIENVTSIDWKEKCEELQSKDPRCNK